MNHNDKLHTADSTEAGLVKSTPHGDTARVRGRFRAECYGADGTLKWTEDYDNSVTDLGVKLMLDGILGNAASGAVVMGLKGTGSVVLADTQASHAGWLEVGAANAPAYSSTRKTPSFSAASGTGAGTRTKTTSAVVVFTFTSGGTVAGSFINIGGSATQDNTTGTLFSAGDFSGSKTVANTDVLNVTYTLSA